MDQKELINRLENLDSQLTYTKFLTKDLIEKHQETKKSPTQEHLQEKIASELYTWGHEIYNAGDDTCKKKCRILASRLVKIMNESINHKVKTSTENQRDTMVEKKLWLKTSEEEYMRREFRLGLEIANYLFSLSNEKEYHELLLISGKIIEIIKKEMNFEEQKDK